MKFCPAAGCRRDGKIHIVERVGKGAENLNIINNISRSMCDPTGGGLSALAVDNTQVSKSHGLHSPGGCADILAGATRTIVTRISLLF